MIAKELFMSSALQRLEVRNAPHVAFQVLGERMARRSVHVGACDCVVARSDSLHDPC